MLVLIHHIKGRDIVVLARLLHQLAHGLPDGHVLADADVVGGHAAADLVLVVGEQQLDVIGGVLIHFVHLVDDLLFVLFFQVVQSIHSVVGVHVGDYLRGLFRRQLFQVGLRVVQVGEDLCHLLHAQDGVQLPALFRRQVGQCVGQVALDDVQNFLYIVFLLHGLPPCPPLKMGTKNTPRLAKGSCGVSRTHAIQDAADTLAMSTSQEKRGFG